MGGFSETWRTIVPTVGNRGVEDNRAHPHTRKIHSHLLTIT